MSLTNDQLGKAIVASGVMPAEELKAFWSALTPDQRPKNGETFAKVLIEQQKLTKFQASELLSGNNTPLVLGEYVLQAKIGAGGMGQVFKAHHRHMDRSAAIKLLPPELTKDAETVKRFQREVKAAAKLSHPNIVQTHDAGVQRGVWYLVMEYVDGRDLADTVAAEGQLPIATAINYIRQAARGLAFAHENGVVHRDIKPANLLLDKRGTIKILDMGLARLDDGMAAAKDGLTQSGQVMGTVDYMAPEQAFDTRHADARADIYSLGCTLYRLLTAQNMYDGESLVQKLMAHQTKPIPVLSKVRADVPAALVPIFAKMVAKQPADRYQTMAEVETALAKLDNPEALANPSTKTDGGGLTSYFKGLLGGKAELAGTGATAAILAEPTAAQLQSGDLLATVNLSNPLQGTDPVSARSIQLVRQNTPRPSSGKKPPIWNRPLVMAAALGGLALVLLGIWVIIKDKDGNEVARVQVPEGGTAEVKNIAAATPTNAAATTSGTDGYALQFDGDDVVEIPKPKIDGSQDFTLEAYVRIDAEDVWGGIVTSTNQVQLEVYTDKGFIWNFYPIFTGRGIKATAPVEVGRRVHVTGVRAGNKVMLFVDGKLRDTKEIPAPKVVINQTWGIGRSLIGQIDEVRITKRARYDKDFVPVPRFEADADTAALYHFDEGQGDVLNDSSGNNLHGKIVGAKWVTADGASIAPPADYALRFDSKSHVTFDKPILGNSTDYTFEAFANIEEAGKWGLIAGSASGVELQFEGQKGPVWNFAVNRGKDWLYQRATATPNRRQHIAGVRQGNTFRIFVDGRLASSQENDKLAHSISQKWLLGRMFNGLIDEHRISKIARYDKDFTPQMRFETDKDTLALYHFDEGQGDVLRDSSGNNHHGKIVGAKWVKTDGSPIAPPAKYALKFDGARDTVTIPTLSRSDAKGPMTIEAYVTPERMLGGPKNSQNIVHVGGPLRMQLYQRAMNWAHATTYVQGSSDSASPPLAKVGERVHVAAVYDGTTAKIYVNGRWQVYSSGHTNIRSSTPGTIIGGGNPPADGDLAGFFAGTIDEIRISKTARYNGEFTPGPRFESDADTLALYHFDEGSGDVLKDSSGNNHHGKIVGAEWVKLDGESNTLGAGHDGALKFLRMKSSLVVPGLQRDGGNFTVECRIKDFGNGSMPLIRINGRVPIVLHLVNRVVHGSERDAIGKIVRNTMGSSLPPSDTWTHVAYVVDPDGTKLFVDGKLQKSVKGPAVAPAATAQFTDSWIGCLSPADPPPGFDGMIDEIRVSSTPRYASDFIPQTRFEPDAQTLALYHFDEGTGDVLRDSSGNNHHGKIVGAKWVKVDEKPTSVPADGGGFLRFDGKARIDLPKLPHDMNRDFTLESYAIFEAPATDRTHVVIARPFYLSFHKSLTPVAEHAPGSLRSEYKNTWGELIQLNQRVHLAAVRSGNMLSLFVDGKLKSSVELTEPVKSTVVDVCKLGEGLVGRMDNVRISRVARYKADFMPTVRHQPDADTVALYHFDEGEGDVLKDSSGNNHHGKIVGAKWGRADGTPLTAALAIAEPTLGQPFELLSLVDLKQDILAGEWTKDGAGFRTEKLSTNSWLRLPIQPGEAYSLHVAFSSNHGNVSVVLPLENKPLEIAFSVKRVELCLNRFNSATNPKVELPEAVQDDKRHEALIEVTRPNPSELKISVSVDGTKALEWRGTRVQLQSIVANPNLHPVLSFGSFLTTQAPAKLFAAQLTTTQGNTKLLRGTLPSK